MLMATLSMRWRARFVRGAITAAAIAALVTSWFMLPELDDRRRLTGWVLFAGILILLSLRLKRALRALPLGSNYRWTQLHIYGGVFLLAALLLHTDFSRNAGPFWWFLSALVWASVLSGLLVIFGARWLPRTLHTYPRNVLYEKIPQYRALCVDQVAALYQQIAQSTHSSLLFKQTADWLFGTINRRQHTLLHLVGSRYPFQAATQRVESIRRYLNEKETELLGELLQVYLQKVELDAQESVQWLYRCLLVAHRVITLAALLPILLHIVIVYAYLDW